MSNYENKQSNRKTWKTNKFLHLLPYYHFIYTVLLLGRCKFTVQK